MSESTRTSQISPSNISREFVYGYKNKMSHLVARLILKHLKIPINAKISKRSISIFKKNLLGPSRNDIKISRPGSQNFFRNNHFFLRILLDM